MAGPLDEAFVEITAELDTRQLKRTAQNAGRVVERELVDGVSRAEKKVSRDSGRVGKTAGRDMGGGFSDGLSAALSSITDIKLPTGGFVVLGGAMSAAAASAVQLGAALAPAVGIIAALPSGIGVLSAGMTTLSVATLGVGEAFEAAATGSAEEFQESVEGMAPPVQAAAQAIRDLMPQLEEFRNSVQGAFFQDFDDVLNSLASTLLGPVTEGMIAVATEINGLITGLASVATSAEGVTFVSQSFEIMAGIIAQVQEPLAALLSSLLSVGVAVNDAFGENAGAGLASLIDNFAKFLDQAAASGAAVQWVTDALEVFQAIGDILSPLVGILGSIGEAAATTGEGILGVFGQVLQTFNEFLASAQGQDVLIGIFESLNTVGSAFATVLGNIAPALPPIIDGIGSILAVVAPLLGPLSELVGSVLTALAPVLSAVAAVLSPLIGPLTTIVELLGGILVEAISAVMPLIELLADLLGGALGVALEVVGAVLEAVAPIFTVLFEALAPLIEALSPLFEILGLIAELVGAVLGPIIEGLGAVLLWLVENVIIPVLVPILENLIETLAIGLGEAIKGLQQNFQLLGIGIEIIWNFIRDTIVARATEMQQGWQNLVNLFKVGWAVLNSQVFTPIKNGINVVRDVVKSALSGITSGWNTFISFIKGIPGKISGALSNMFAPLASGFRSAINSVIRGWNNLSFSIPSVDIPGIGRVGGGTINTPNLSYLAQGGLLTGPTLNVAGEAGTEAVLPLENTRVMNMIASAIGRVNTGPADNSGGTVGNAVSAGNMGDIILSVRIGDRELNDIIVERIDENNRVMLRRARTGTRRNG